MRAYIYRLATDAKNGFVETVLKSFLLLLSFLYGAVVRAVLFCYRVKILKQKKLPRPVVSIGNMTLGGVGKTPLVMLVAAHLKGQGWKPAILTRGYRSEKGKAQSDEAELLKETGVPVLVGKNRFETAQKALTQEDIDIFILDDGFQHWALSRDLDIVLIDATKPFGNGALLPRGILREPLSSLKRAGMFVLTKTDLTSNSGALVEQLKAMNPAAPIVETVHAPLRLKGLKENQIFDLSFLQNRNVVALSGIGDPASFEALLKRLGAKVAKHFSFPDHHRYGAGDLLAVGAYAQEKNISFCVTTDKDAVKLRALLSPGSDLNFLSLQIKIQIMKGSDEFFRRISDYLHR